MASDNEADLLEDGELPSSEDEREETKSIESNKINESEAINQVTSDESRKSPAEQSQKRPFESPERDNEEENNSKIQEDATVSPAAKRSKTDNEGSEGEEGEIFSDDEEAAYYPQLVKTKRDNTTSSSHDTYGHHGNRENHTPYRSREGGRYHSRRWQYEGDRRDRGRGSDLVGPPIRHERFHGDKKWNEYTPSLTLETIESRLSRMLALLPTPKTMQISLDEMNYPAPPQWYLKSVSAYNKSRGVHRHAHSSGIEGISDESVGVVGYTDEEHQSPVKAVDSLSRLTDAHVPPMGNKNEVNHHVLPQPDPSLPPPPPLVVAKANPVSTETRTSPAAPVPFASPVNPHLQESGETHQSLSSSSSSSLVTEDNASNRSSTGPPSSSLVGEEEEEEEEEEATSTEAVGKAIFTKATGTKGKSQNDIVGKTTSPAPALSRRKRNLRSRGRQQIRASPLLVSIKLSKLSVAEAEHKIVRDDDSNFNYDDYLDQLNDEEEEEDEDRGDSYNFKAAAADFWIDTHPARTPAGGGEEEGEGGLDVSSDPLDSDFPLLRGNLAKTHENETGTGGATTTTGGATLKSLVGQGLVDDSILSIEGKGAIDDSQKLKKSLSKMKIPRKRKERASSTKEGGGGGEAVVKPAVVGETAQTPQQVNTHAVKPPCKYFLNGHCIHRDNCQFSHAVKREKKREMCKFFLQDACDKGDDCLFYHGGFPCRYFHTRHMCYHGEKCKFSHAPLNDETYEILMSVIEPHMREFVRYPPPPPPSLPPPSSLPPSHVQPYDASHAPDSGLAPPIAPPTNHQGPPGGVPYPRQNHQQPNENHWTPDSLYTPQSLVGDERGGGGGGASGSFGTGGYDETLYWSSQREEEERLKANVKLSPSFDVAALFPQPHPQVLPHELATQLRKVLLPTPLSSSKEKQDEGGEKGKEEELELEYWENKDKKDLNDNAGQEKPSTHPPPSSHPPPSHSPPPSSHPPPLHPPPLHPPSSHPPPSHHSPPLIQPAGVHPHQPPINEPRPHLDQPCPQPRPPLMPEGLVGPRPAFVPRHPPPPGLVLIHGLPPPPRHFPPHPPIVIRGSHPPPQMLVPPFHPPGGPSAPLMGPSPPQHSVGPPNIQPPPHLGGPGIIGETAPDPRAANDPRFSRSTVQQSPPRHLSPTHSDVHHHHNAAVTSSSSFTSSLASSSLPPSRSSERTASPSSTKPVVSSGGGGGRGGAAMPTTSSSVWGSSGGGGVSDSVRSVNPREKYSHLKIKSKTESTSSHIQSSLKKPTGRGGGRDDSSLPSLLQKNAMLDKPLPPHELFGTPPKEADNISLFGSRHQVPDSPNPNEAQAFGEIKMVVNDSEDPLKDGSKVGGDSGESHTPSVPSYLTHLGLGLQEDENDVQIESAFGSLQARQRRLSEISSSIVSEDTMSSQPEPHLSSSDTATPTTNESNISKMFSFGSSLY